MNIPIKTSFESFFSVYVEVLNPILKLTKREKEMLAELLKFYYRHRTLSQLEISSKMFSKETRKVLRDSIQMSEPSFNNHLVQLRTKKILIGEEINPTLLKNLPKSKTSKLDIAFKLDING